MLYIVLANLTVDLLTFYSLDIQRVLKNSGYLVMSGIINTRQDEIVNTMQKLGIKILKHIQKGDWHTYIAKKL